MSVVRWLSGLGVLLCVGCGTDATRATAPVAQGLAAPAAAPARARAPRMTSEELVERLRARLSRPEGELRVQTGRDGTHRIALDGHLQHVTIAAIGADGKVHTSCVDRPEAVAHALSAQPRGAN